MSISAKAKKRVTDRIRADVKTINAHYNTDFTVPGVVYDGKGGAAGFVTPRDNHSIIHLNPVYFVKDEDEMVDSTTPHELAHWAENRIYGGWERIGRKRSIHGRRWKAIMSVIGADDSRTHTMDRTHAPRKTRKKYEYSCGTCPKTHTLSSVIHNRILRQTHTYNCNCGGDLILTKALGKVTYGEARASQDQPKPKVKPAAHRATTGTTKKARAQSIIDRCPSTDKDGIIAKFISELDMSKAGANTYYYNLVTNA